MSMKKRQPARRSRHSGSRSLLKTVPIHLIVRLLLAIFLLLNVFFGPESGTNVILGNIIFGVFLVAIAFEVVFTFKKNNAPTESNLQYCQTILALFKNCCHQLGKTSIIIHFIFVGLMAVGCALSLVLELGYASRIFTIYLFVRLWWKALTFVSQKTHHPSTTDNYEFPDECNGEEPTVGTEDDEFSENAFSPSPEQLDDIQYYYKLYIDQPNLQDDAIEELKKIFSSYEMALWFSSEEAQHKDFMRRLPPSVKTHIKTAEQEQEEEEPRQSNQQILARIGCGILLGSALIGIFTVEEAMRVFLIGACIILLLPCILGVLGRCLGEFRLFLWFGTLLTVLFAPLPIKIASIVGMLLSCVLFYQPKKLVIPQDDESDGSAFWEERARFLSIPLPLWMFKFYLARPDGGGLIEFYQDILFFSDSTEGYFMKDIDITTPFLTYILFGYCKVTIRFEDKPKHSVSIYAPRYQWRHMWSSTGSFKGQFKNVFDVAKKEAAAAGIYKKVST